MVCILDEGHLIEKETLEEFRFLLNYRFDSMSLRWLWSADFAEYAKQIEILEIMA